MICDKTKPLDKFAKNQRKDPHAARCKSCIKMHLETEPDYEPPDSDEYGESASDVCCSCSIKTGPNLADRFMENRANRTLMTTENPLPAVVLFTIASTRMLARLVMLPPPLSPKTPLVKPTTITGRRSNRRAAAPSPSGHRCPPSAQLPRWPGPRPPPRPQPRREAGQGPKRPTKPSWDRTPRWTSGTPMHGT